MIQQYQSSSLQECCQNSFTHYFWGAHYVPRSEEFLEDLGGFFEEVLVLKGDTKWQLGGDQEEAWEDCEDWEDSKVL